MTERESTYLWSVTAATNASVDPNINFAEGQLPGTLNNSNRAAMAGIARYLKDTNASITTGGSANAYTITLNTTKTAYASGFQVVFKASFSNTGAATLNVTNADASAIGAKAIRMFDVTGEIALPANAIRANGLYYLIYDTAANSAAGGFILLNPAVSVLSDATLFPNFIGGLTLSNDGGTPNTVLDIAAGCANDSTNAALIRIGAFTKSISGAWTSGTGNNGMGNGLTATASTWYHVILANNSGTPDIYFDTSATGANRPAGISDTKVRRIGSFKLDGSVHILTFSQVGNDFLWGAVILEQNGVTPPSSATLITLTGAPSGIKVVAKFRGALVAAGSTANQLLIQSPDETSAVSGGTAGNSDTSAVNGTTVINSQFNILVRTDTSARVRWSAVLNSGTAYLDTYGWHDYRGQV